MKIDIDYNPKDINEGTVVRLVTSAPSANHNYKYTWMLDENLIVNPVSDPGLCLLDTTGLQPGSYKISVRAELDPADQENVPRGARQGEGETALSVQPRSLSSYDLDRLTTEAKEFAQYLKHNFDGKMESLTKEVSKVASGVGGFAPSSGVRQPLKVALQRSSTAQTGDQALWIAIRHHTEMIGFNRYSEFIDLVLCRGQDSEPGALPGPLNLGSPPLGDRRDDLNNRPTIHGVDAYELLRTATEIFLILECGLLDKSGKIRHGETLNITEEESRLGISPLNLDEITLLLKQYLGPSQPFTLPYLKRIVNALFGIGSARSEEKLPYCEGILKNRFSCPSLIELIWSYWHEEGMLAQTMNAIALRFQNRHRGGDRDPLAHLEIDPLQSLNNLFWGYIQNEQKRLSVPRRAYEYDHHYGLTLYGKAVPTMRSADSRSKFLESFHNLLYRTSVFYHEDADTTVIADGFPLLTALRETHLLLAEGAHNQFGDLPWTARVEMLIEQWLLARPELREFLRGRAMVPYKEAWMGQVDTMKKLQGWTDTTITHFSDLGVWGEQILLSIRYGDWIDVNDQEQAKNWARYWRPEIQGYIHAYRAATGVDLAVEPVAAEKASERYFQPSTHLRNRLVEQQKGSRRA